MINRMQHVPTTKKTTFRVLVIDADERDREQTTRALGKSWPFDRDLKVIWAGDTADALAKLQFERCTLILLGGDSPHSHGMEVLRQLRTEGVRIPAVMVSALRRDDILDALDELAAAHVHDAEMNMHTFYDAIGKSLQLLGFIPRSTPTMAAG